LIIAERAHSRAALLERRQHALRVLRSGEALSFVDASGMEIDDVRLMNQLRFVEEDSKCLGFHHPPPGMSRVEFLRCWAPRSWMPR
jgi:hypothetical protein